MVSVNRIFSFYFLEYLFFHFLFIYSLVTFLSIYLFEWTLARKPFIPSDTTKIETMRDELCLAMAF